MLRYSMHKLLTVSFGTFLLISALASSAEAALVRRAVTLNASQTGTGFFDYDDSALTADPITGGQFTSILNAAFAFSGEAQQSISDPLAAVNFDSTGTFLGIDLELPPPSGLLETILIANGDAYLPSSALVGEFGVVSYGDPTPVPTPALLPGVLGVGVGLLRKCRQGQRKASA